MKKAVFFDVDGTLISYSTNPAHIPEATREALEALQRNGHIVALATGRSLATAGRLMREFGIENAVLCSGAHSIMGWEDIQTIRIPQDTAESVVRMAVDAGCAVFACTDRYMYAYKESDETRRFVLEQSILGDVMRPISEIRDVCMFNIYGETLPPKESFPDLDSIYEPYGIELRPSGVSKATGMKVLAGRLGIDLGDTVAFGDGANDAEMLRAAGVGVAVGNGNKAACAAADMVCAPIDEGGILTALKRLELI